MDLPHKRQLGVGWLNLIGARLLRWWPVKTSGTTFSMAAFFVVYFRLLQHPLYSAAVMPVSSVDWLTGFRPEALPLYLSLWVYVSPAPALLIDRRELVSYALAAFGLSVMGLGIFLRWPTTVLRPEVEWSQHATFAFLKSVDASRNACPSLHMAFAAFTGVWFERLLRQMGTGHERALHATSPGNRSTTYCLERASARADNIPAIVEAVDSKVPTCGERAGRRRD